MKKQLLKLTLIVAVLFSAAATYAQADLLWTKEGYYKIGARGTNLFMTINGATGALEWAEEITTGDTSVQEWAIVNHRTPASSGLMEITSKAGGVDWTLTTTLGEEADHPAYTLKVEARLPKEVEADDYTGLDQFQRRKAKVDANGDADSGGANPAGGNNALFLRTPWGTNSRFGVTPAAAGDPVQFDGGGIDVLDFHFVRDIEVASVNTFGVDAFTISNPVNNELTIRGATSKVSELVVYSVLGNKVLSRSINKVNGDVISLNVSDLSTGLYIVKMTGNNGEKFTKKIIKQ